MGKVTRTREKNTQTVEQITVNHYGWNINNSGIFPTKLVLENVYRVYVAKVNL